MTRNNRIKPSGFTLIELLVVITIISVLIAILLPALRSARVAAQAVQSLSQARSIGFALVLYSEDWKSHLPYSRNDTPAASSGAYWPGLLYHGGHQPNFGLFWGPGRSNTGLTVSTMKTNAGFHHWRYVGYAANYNGAMPQPSLNYFSPLSGPTGTLRLGALRNPSPNRHILLGEAFRMAWFDGTTAVTGATNPDGTASLTVHPTDTNMFSHDGKVVRTYVDGHGNMNQGQDMGWTATSARTGSWDTANFSNALYPFFDFRYRSSWN